MPLPAIAPYELPTQDDLPAPRVPWQLDPHRAALLIHDMQRYFLEPYQGSPVDELITNIADILVACRDRGVPVFYSAQPGHQAVEDRGLLSDFWGRGIGAVIDEQPGAADIVDDLAPAGTDTVLTKWRYSAFQRSPLAERLAELGRDQLLITGVYAHIGCQATAVDAFMGDIGPFLVADAVADFSRPRHDQACEYVANRCGVVTATHAVLQALAAVTPAVH